jgi:hypothetical protein
MGSETGIERVNYFQGQMLTAADFQVEQEYFLAKQRRHNRCLHGWGVVCGLAVSVTGSSEILVEPGTAIDCAGNEIHLSAQASLALPQAPEVQYIVIQYLETETAPVPLASSPADPHREGTACTRIVEGVHLDILDANPSAGHRGKKAGTPGCGLPHPLCIARLRKSRKGWKVEERSRRRC